MNLQYLTVFLVTLAACWLLLPRIIHFCEKRELFDYPAPRKLHQRPTPRLGGIAMFLSCMTAWGIGYFLWPEILPEFDDLTIWLLSGSLVISGLGFWDDVKPIRFRYKILVEALVGIGLIFAGLKIKLLFIPFWEPVELGWGSFPVSLIWFLGLLNSINLIDGLDGLAAGVSAIAAATLFMVGLHFKAYLVSFLMAGIMAACLGFLRYNISPAKIFMGDSGSLFLGYLFAVSSVICPIKSYTAVTMFVPLVALGVPVLETISSFLRRSFRLKKFYAADNQHIYNLLLNLGVSKKNTILIIWGVSIFFSGFSLLLMTKSREFALPILSLAIGLTLAVSILTYIYGYKMRSKEKRVTA